MKNKFASLIMVLAIMVLNIIPLSEASSPEELRIVTMGAELYDLTPNMKKLLNSPKQKGVVVVNVFPETPAETAGLQTGDIILDLNGKKYRDYSALLKAITTSSQEVLQFQVYRAGQILSLSSTPVEPQKIKNPEFQNYFEKNLYYSQLIHACQNNMFNKQATYWYVQHMERLLMELELTIGDNFLRLEKYNSLRRQLKAIRNRLR